VSTKSHRVCHDVVADRFLVKRLGGQSPGRQLQHLSRRDPDRGSKRASFRRSAHDQNHPLRIRQNIQRTRARSIGGLECAYRLFIAGKLSAALKDGKAPLNPIQALIVSTEINTEELIEYSANAFFAMRVTFVNEIAGLYERASAGVHDVARAIGRDGRIRCSTLRIVPAA
jgi:UDP-glucose/GDP-mannose dehydrogenase family, central domain